MEVIEGIEFSLEAESILGKLHIEPGSGDAESMLPLIDLAREVGRPKAAYSVCYIAGRDGDRVEIGDITFESRMLARNLAEVERVFPFVATCGHEMDEAFTGDGDILKQYCWDIIKDQMLKAAREVLVDELQERYRLEKTAAMHPGSGDVSIWPVEQQRNLFSLLGDVEQSVGVRLTESCLMMPNKTVSGILFPTESDFRSCEVCKRENCPSRRAAFRPELWREIDQG